MNSDFLMALHLPDLQWILTIEQLIQIIYSCVSLLRSPNLWSIHIMVNIYGEQEKCVEDCLNIPVDSASGHGQ